MFFFQKKKEEPKPAPVKAAPVSKPSAPVDPDDFFKNMGRKREAPKEVVSIETPEVTGLREGPAARPVSTIKEFASDISTEGLIDKTLLAPDEALGNINEVVTENMDIDDEFERMAALKEAKANAPEEPKKPLTADDFFKDMGRRAKRRDDEPIESPEITGLRDAPPPPAVSTISEFSAEISTDVLRDKTLETSKWDGDIKEVDISTLDMSVLHD